MHKNPDFIFENAYVTLNTTVLKKGVKKMATAKSTKKTNTKSSKIVKKIPHLYREKNPDNHKLTGKFICMYAVFSVAIVVFAAVSVYLFVVASELQAKYDGIDVNCRNGKCELVQTSFDDANTAE